MKDREPFIIAPGIEEYAELHSSQEPPLLARLNRETHLRSHLPQMLSGNLQGAFLRMISRMIKPLNILEIGTFTGYSALCLAEGLEDGGKLHTIEVNPEILEIAEKYFREAGMEGKIIQHTGNALEIIPELNGPFDLVFIDANKEDYIEYFKLVIEKVRPGGWVLADNTLWYGRVLEEIPGEDTESTGIVAFNEFVRNYPGIDAVLLILRDGLTLIRKI